MSDEPQVSAQETKETPAPPTPVISAPSGGQPQSVAPTIDEDKLVAKLIDRLDEVIEKKVQSKTDRRLSRVDGFYADMESLKGYLQKNKGDVDAAYREMAIDDLLQQRAASGAVPGRTAEPEPQVDPLKVADILNEAEVQFDDPDVVAWSKKQYADVGDAYRDLSRMVTKKVKQGRAASGSPVLDAGTTVVQSGNEDADSLTDKLAELQRQPTKNQAAIGALSRKLEALVRR